MTVAAILGKKVGMTQVYDDNNRVVPVTVIKAGPCVVLDIRTMERDGYEAVQLGFDDAKVKNTSQSVIAHCGKTGSTPKRFIREFRIEGAADQQPGDIVNVDTFEENEVKYVDVTAISKGKGFAGVMKRYNFGGQLDSHGVERKHRSAGSQSSHGTDLGHGGDIKKGKRMGGHMGHARITVRNQKLFGIVKEDGLMLVRGNVPGPNGGYVMVRSVKAMKPKIEG